MDEMELKLRDWYNRHISAAWYRSYSLIGGWLTAAIAFLPDLLQWAVVDNFELFAGIVLPTLDPMWKAALLGFYVAFVAPPLRAWVQRKMQEATIRQQAEAGKVIPLPASGVSAGLVLEVVGEMQAQAAAEPCGATKTPPGWYCTRALGHEGPCAAREL